MLSSLFALIGILTRMVNYTDDTKPMLSTRVDLFIFICFSFRFRFIVPISEWYALISIEFLLNSDIIFIYFHKSLRKSARYCIPLCFYEKDLFQWDNMGAESEVDKNWNQLRVVSNWIITLFINFLSKKL